MHGVKAGARRDETTGEDYGDRRHCTTRGEPLSLSRLKRWPKPLQTALLKGASRATLNRGVFTAFSAVAKPTACAGGTGSSKVSAHTRAPLLSPGRNGFFGSSARASRHQPWRPPHV